MLSPRLLCLLTLATPALAGELSPEVQLCLQHFRAGERTRAEKALGPMDGIPLYRVQLDADPPGRKVTGIVQISYPVGERALSELYLRVTPNAMGAERIQLFGATVDGHEVMLEQPEPALFQVKLEPPAPAKAVVVLEFHVRARVPKAVAGSDGLGAFMGSVSPSSAPTDHGAFSATPELMGLVGVLPMIPPLDEEGHPSPGPAGFGDLALYAPAHVLAAVTVPRGYRVHATGEAMGEVPEPDGRVRFSFGAAAVRDFPVFVSRGYAEKTVALDDLTVESDFATEDREMGEKVLGFAAAAAAEYQKRFGPLPYKRLRVVEAPLTDGAGGMEFPGLVTVATALYRGAKDPAGALLGSSLGALAPLLSSPDMRQALNLPDMGRMFGNLLEFSVAHEVAHQYFAGLVGSDPIREPVVDEALAQYAALLYVEWRHGKKAAERFRQEQLVTAYQMYRLTGGADGVADRATDAFDSPLEYAALVYGKAPLLHAEERKLVGDAAFFKGLKSYVDTYRYRWSCDDCLTRQLGAESPGAAKKLEALRQRWWLEAHGDEDLGQGDLGGLLQGMTGTALDPQTQKLLEQLIPQLIGP